MALHRLRTSREVRTVLEEGTVYRGPLFVARRMQGQTPARIAVIASKKRVGKAHDRNRARRRLRAATRAAGLQSGDLVLIANPRVLKAEYRQLITELKRAFA